MAIFAVLATVAFIDQLLREDFKQETRSDVLNQVTATRANLEQALNERLFLVQGLAAHVSSRSEIKDAEFRTLAKQLMGERTGIRSLQLAPDSVVTYVFPVEGNEEAIGHDLLGDPARRDAVQRAIDNREFVIAGPVELRQGGVALIGRTPIFLELADGSEQYWGLAIILIDFDPLLMQAGLFDESQDIKYVIRGKDGLGASGEVFFGDEDALDTDPVTSVVSLPNGSWQLAATPAAGWSAASPASQWIWSLGAVLALMGGFLIWYLVSAPDRLRTAVQKATTALRQTNRELLDARSQAATDALTGLRNHRSFHERIRDKVQHAQGNGNSVGLIMLDIDNFKSINDSSGHQAGDHILRRIASALTGVVGEENTFRYGGDEFAVLLPAADRPKTARIAERLRHAVQSGVNGRGEKVTVSVGVALFPNTARSAEELIYGADAAMYWAKSAGKNRVADWRQLLEDTASGALPWYAAERGVRAPEVVDALVAALAAKDPITAAHTERCSWYALELAQELSLGDEETSIVRLASLLHDIGKLAIPDGVLCKEGPLSQEEWALMKQHPTAAQHVLRQIRSVADAIPAILHHHEHFDGSGYRDGLAGDEIPIASRILLVTDAFDAMTTDRPYRKAMPIEAAIEELQRNSGIQFDPAVVEAFLKILSRTGAQPLFSMTAARREPAAGAPGQRQTKR